MVVTLFDLCVANKETGEPGSLVRRYINEHAQGDPYSGAFQWEASKWKAGGGLRFASSPARATWLEQVRVFHRNGRNGEWTYGNWPTIAGCEGYRHG